MPNFAVFRDAVAYYAIFAHEATHWAQAAADWMHARQLRSATGEGDTAPDLAA